MCVDRFIIIHTYLKKRCRIKKINYERYQALDLWDAQKRASILIKRG